MGVGRRAWGVGVMTDRNAADFFSLSQSPPATDASRPTPDACLCSQPILSFPPIYGLNTGGTVTLPSLFCHISRIGMSSRGLAATVLFSE